MEEEVKKDIWKIFSVASFLFVTIFFLLPYLVQISTYFHEKAHQKALSNYNIENSYSLNLLDTIHNFYNPNVQKLGVTRFDLGAYEQLDKYKKADINIAGIVSDLRFLFLIGIYLSFVNIYLFYKIRFKQEYNVKWAIAVDWVLFMWLLALIQITVANITYSSGDVYQLVRFIGA